MRKYAEISYFDLAGRASDQQRRLKFWSRWLRVPTVEAAVRQPLACLLADEIERTFIRQFQCRALVTWILGGDCASGAGGGCVEAALDGAV